MSVRTSAYTCTVCIHTYLSNLEIFQVLIKGLTVDRHRLNTIYAQTTVLHNGFCPAISEVLFEKRDVRIRYKFKTTYHSIDCVMTRSNIRLIMTPGVVNHILILIR